MPEILIRTDGGHHIGSGHLVRCMALAEMLRNDFEITFFCKEIPESFENDLAYNNFCLVKIFNENEFFKRVTNEKIIVLDGYQYDTSYQKKVKAIGARLVCIDDIHDKEFVADLIINHTPGITPRDYKARPYTQFALGLDYVLLRSAFLKQAMKPRTNERIENVLICFGGSDPDNQTLKTLKALTHINWIVNIHIVIGSLYKEKKSLKEYIKNSKDLPIFLHHDISAKGFVRVMKKCQVGITAASVISLECLAVHIILFIKLLADNQKYLYHGLIKENYASEMNDFFSKDVKNLNYIKPVIDGFSKNRLSVLFKSL
jgi:UDP-2,4-diacetamido-2,4,6-trideoxy-beta-L-altropyranose hydrolase